MISFSDKVERFTIVSSTQDVAKKRATEGAPEGTVIVAESQDHGRGRLGRRWISPPGGLWLSVVLRPSINPPRLARVTVLAAVTLALSIREVTGTDAGIKWPNDILINGKKVAGILTEAAISHNRVEHVILGIGINVNIDTSVFPHDLLMPATALRDECGGEVDIEALLMAILKNLKREYDLLGRSYENLVDVWRKFSVTLGHKVKVSQTGRFIEGKAVDLDEDGALLIKDENGKVVAVYAGDLILLR